MTQLDLVLGVGTLSHPALREALVGHGVGLNEHAETLLSHEVFEVTFPQSVHVVSATVGDLGFCEGARLNEIFTAAKKRGWELCPPETGPYLRMALLEQASAPDSLLSVGRAPTSAITVASRPLHEDDGYPKGFYLRVIDGRPWLRGYRCDGGHLWSSDDMFAFRRPAP